MRSSRALVALCLPALLVASLVGPAVAATPAGFEAPEELFNTISPTDLAFTPDGSLLFTADKSGGLYVSPMTGGNPANPPTLALDLEPRLCTETERGLLGVAADPNFAANRHIYLYYTWDRGLSAPDRCPIHVSGEPFGSTTPVNRVARFTLGANNLVDPATEAVLIDNIPSPGGHHNGGALVFGTDGYLYISIGDGGCDYKGGVNSCDAPNDASRDQNVLLGKILRIIPDPGLTPAERIPPDNPFRATGAVCALVGVGPVGMPCQETFAWGLRNPFRIAFDPNVAAPAVRFFINDVGENTWEEINRGEAGADYRWNECEGLFITNSATPCDAPVGMERDPIHTYAHGGAPACNSITGGAFVPQGAWPAPFDGTYLFADYVCGQIFAIDADAPAPDTRTLFADEMAGIVDIEFGPAPNGTALYYTRINESGIFRIRPSSGGNRAPVAAFTASPLYGSRVVSFDASASSDPDGDGLEYLWNFGNGETRTTDTPTIANYEYAVDGRYTITLQVRDENGAISLNTAVVRIDTVNTPPVVTITSPAAGALFSVGQALTLEATATDAEDGALPDTAFRWEVLRHHRAGQPGAHTHPWFGPQIGNRLVFTAPAPEDLEAANNSYIEIRLTVTDSDEGTTTVTRDVMPNKVSLTFNTEPAGLEIDVNGVTLTGPQTIVSWEGYGLEVVAPQQAGPGGASMRLSSWSDGPTTAQRTIITPAAPATYTAVFEPVEEEAQTPPPLFLPLVIAP